MKTVTLEPLVLQVLRALWRAQWSGGGTEPECRVTMQELLRETGASLAHVQVALEELSRRHCEIDRTHAGVRLRSTGLECWRDILEDFSQRHDLRLARRVMVFGKTDSTNDIAAQCAASPDVHGLVVLADEQTAGRGRPGHRWESKAGQSVLMSVVLRAEGQAESVDRLTLAAALAAAIGIERAVERAGKRLESAIQIKWPNDLHIGGRKLAGILVERHRDDSGASVVLGLGINVTQAAGDFPAELGDRALSLLHAAGGAIDRTLVAAAVLESLDETLHDLLRGDGWIDEWKRRCGMLGKKVRARSGEKLIAGEVIDVAPLQGLVVRDELGGTHFLSAQTSTLQ